jgi:hypothetical protein
MATSPNYSWPEPDNTDLVKNGALAIRTMGNAIDTTMATMTPKSTYTAKGSIAAATGASTPANLSVGNNGETLVADSSTSTGLRYQSNFAAGKNKIINGDFGVWQRGTSFTPAGGGVIAYTADRFRVLRDGTGATVTVSQQAFTLGTAPVSGYEGTYFLRFAQSVAGTGGTYNVISQPVEDVRTFAGQTITISFWAKGAAGATLGAPAIAQTFGSGGSGTVYTTIGAPQTLTTSWQRFSFTGAIPSITGKTIGTGSFLDITIYLPNNSTFTWDFWGVQVEAGSVATAFQTATGTIQGELAACQRYYIRYGNLQPYSTYGIGVGNNLTQTYTPLQIKSMRVAPTALDYSGLQVTDIGSSQVVNTLVLETNNNSDGNVLLTATVTSGLIAYRPYILRNNNSSSSYIGLSAEL